MIEKTCPRCGAKLIEEVVERTHGTDDGGIVIDVNPVYICTEQCGYIERYEHMPEIRFQEGDDRLLLVYPDEQGRILELKDMVIWPPNHYLSILGRGDWQEYRGNHDVEVLLENARDNDAYGRKQPNLFEFATSELSQDAFLCWLLAWSEDAYRSINKPLHQAALDFISMIFNVHGEPVPLIKKIQIERQFKGLDVLAVVNDRYAILIEDKTFTKNHSDQLRRYSEAVKIRNPKWIQLPIYYKIADQSHYKSVIDAHYFPFTRERMLQVLRRGHKNGVTHDVFLDYLTRLEWLDEQYKAFKYMPVQEWDSFAWQGFYVELQKEFDGHWGYVSNRKGGFWGFWWMPENFIDRSCYLQLEENRLCVKLTAADEVDLLEKARTVLSSVLAEAEKKGLLMRKPKQLRTGKTMTIAHRPGIIQTIENGIVDLEKTIGELRKWEW
ncbi:PD-(D/E)XK nuclease family protein [Mesobacillus sp. AQ2]|uniref:PD-(D/E)XK nuclease family protein n=1 Tax=Mesobacillus sp. AQ2 TaxID=3043332 RepID=UPI0024C12F95|nr:PD-(D/E)XK nuclease family protein [Mesobacillus sp. AQ2]WHX40316.1 PD-(D/E)XK nuclease family protein [Mesobacillus sp. AQ2]